MMMKSHQSSAAKRNTTVSNKITKTTSDRPKQWPSNILYITEPVYSQVLAPSTIEALRAPISAACLVVANTAANTHVTIRMINSPLHPAHGQHGLFAACDLEPDNLILPYFGLVHSNSADDTNPLSNYDISLDREIGVSVDAATMGNEARFVNDYRGVPGCEGPNAEFRDCWIRTKSLSLGNVSREDQGTVMERCIGIFVLSKGKKAGTKRARGIKKGDEILVSYGKGFWKSLDQEESAETQSAEA